MLNLVQEIRSKLPYLALQNRFYVPLTYAFSNSIAIVKALEPLIDISGRSRMQSAIIQSLAQRGGDL